MLLFFFFFLSLLSEFNEFVSHIYKNCISPFCLCLIVKKLNELVSDLVIYQIFIFTFCVYSSFFFSYFLFSSKWLLYFWYMIMFFVYVIYWSILFRLGMLLMELIILYWLCVFCENVEDIIYFLCLSNFASFFSLYDVCIMR
jgi:hypothetical protein